MRKITVRLLIDGMLILVAIAVLVYNFSIGRRIAYAASIVAVIGTIAILIADLLRKKRKEK